MIILFWLFRYIAHSNYCFVQTKVLNAFFIKILKEKTGESFLKKKIYLLQFLEFLNSVNMSIMQNKESTWEW